MNTASYVWPGIVSVVGIILTWMLGRQSKAADERHETTLQFQEKQTLALTLLDREVTKMSAVFGPTVAELERMDFKIADMSKDITILKEWRIAHEAWSRESIGRLEAGLATRRRTDAL